MKAFILFACFILTVLLMPAQQTGCVKYPHLGIEFTIPADWAGQEIDGGFFMGHATIPGLILITTHEYQSLDPMRNGAVEGINDGNGSSLVLASPLQPLGTHALGGAYQGTIEWQPARAYGVGPINQGLLPAVGFPHLRHDEAV